MDFFLDTLENGYRDMRKTNRNKEKRIVLSKMKGKNQVMVCFFSEKRRKRNQR